MKLIAILILLAGLSACGAPAYRNGGQGPSQFDLGSAATADVASGRRNWRLVVASPSWMEDSAMRYRLSYADPAQVLEYTQSRWVGPPGELLRRRLEEQLYWPAGSGVSQCGVLLELRRFEQDFTSAADSRGRVAVHAVLRRGGVLVDERDFSVSAPARTPDAPGGVAALAAATDQLARGLMQWQDEAIRTGSWAACWN